MRTTSKCSRRRTIFAVVASICASACSVVTYSATASPPTPAATPPALDADTRRAILDCTFEVIAQARDIAPARNTAFRPSTHTILFQRERTTGLAVGQADRSPASSSADFASTTAFGTTANDAFGARKNEFASAGAQDFPAFEKRPAPLGHISGTAFCFGDGTLATAAHVLEQAIGDRFETPVIRDRRGKFYAFEHIVRYSMPDDFVVFTVAGLAPRPARPHHTSADLSTTLYVAWRRGDGDIALTSAQYVGRSTVATLGRDGWILLGPAPRHGASGGPVLDASGRVVGLLRGRSSESADAVASAVPIELMDAASTREGSLGMSDPMFTLGMPSGRNEPLRGGIPLPSSWERFERHVIDTRNTYFAYMLPYSLSLEGQGAPMSDRQRADLCVALEPGHCDERVERASTTVRHAKATKGCNVAWNGVGAALVRCHTRTERDALKAAENPRMQVAATTLAWPKLQAPPAPCSNANGLADVVSAGEFTDRTGAEWRIQARPLQDCDWMVVSMTRALPDGTLTWVRGAPSAYTDAAVMQLKALTNVECESCRSDLQPGAVLAKVPTVQGEVQR